MSDRDRKPLRSLKTRVGHRYSFLAGSQDADVEVARVEADAAAGPETRRSCLVDSAVYVDGARVESPTTLAESYQSLNTHQDGMAWIGLYRPDRHDLASVGSEFGLHELAIEDAILAHQRPKLERYDDTLFIVLRAARYRDDLEQVDFGEVHAFIGENFVITVRHSEAPDLSAARRRLENNPNLLRLGPEAVLYAILDRVVDGYAPVVAGLSNDLDEIQAEVFSGDPSVSRRTYELSREVIEFQRATKPLTTVLKSLVGGVGKFTIDAELQRYLRDVEDHLTQVVEQVHGLRDMLGHILTVNATLVGQKQNEEMKSLTEISVRQNDEVKKISAWAAILFAPTLIGTVYGMNFHNMPELHWKLGYPYAITLMVIISLLLYLAFKKRRWI